MISTVNKAPGLTILLNIMLLSTFFNLLNAYCASTMCLHLVEKNQILSHIR